MTAWVGWEPLANGLDLVPWYFNDGLIVITDPRPRFSGSWDLCFYRLCWDRAADDPVLVPPAGYSALPPGQLLDRVRGSLGTTGQIAGVVIKADPADHAAILEVVREVVVATLSRYKGGKLPRRRKRTVPAPLPRTYEAAEALWQPQVNMVCWRWGTTLSALGTIHGFSGAVDNRRFGDRDTSARALPGAAFIKSTISRPLIQTIRAALAQRLPWCAAAVAAGAGSTGCVVAHTSLGRLIRLGAPFPVDSPSMAAELLELAMRPSITHLLLGVRWWGFSRRTWMGEKPEWRQVDEVRFTFDHKLKRCTPFDEHPFPIALTAAAVQGHCRGRPGIAVGGNDSTTWTCIDLDFGHGPNQDPQARAANTARYREALRRITAAFPAAVIEARMTRCAADDVGFYPVRGETTLVTRQLYRAARGLRHYSADDPDTTVHGVHVWLRWAGWYPCEELIEVMSDVLTALGVAEVRHGEGGQVEIYPRGNRVLSLPLRCSPLSLWVRSKNESSLVTHLDYILVDADLVPLFGPLKARAERKDPDAIKAKDFLEVKEYLARMWAHLDTRWQATDPPPGVPLPQLIGEVSCELGETEYVGGKWTPSRQADQLKPSFYQPGPAASSELGLKLLPKPATGEWLGRQIMKPVRFVSTRTALDRQAWRRWAEGVAQNLPSAAPLLACEPVPLRGIDADPLVVLGLRGLTDNLGILEMAVSTFPSAFHGGHVPPRLVRSRPQEPVRFANYSPQYLQSALEQSLAQDQLAASLDHGQQESPESDAAADADESGGEAGPVDAVAVQEQDLTVASCRLPLETPPQLGAGLRAQLRRLHGIEDYHHLEAVTNGNSNGQIMYLVRVVQRNCGSYRDAEIVLAEMLEVSHDYQGDRAALIDKLRHTWNGSIRRVLNQKRYQPRKQASKSQPLTPEQIAWIRATVQSARASDPDLKNTLRKAATVEVWISVLGSIVQYAQSMTPEQWKFHKIPDWYLRPKTADRPDPAVTAKKRFSNKKATRQFLAWLDRRGYAKRDGKMTIPGQPHLYDITALMVAVPGRTSSAAGANETVKRVTTGPTIPSAPGVQS